ncbi:serine/threonine-protein kinase [Streptomyces sp. NPDC050560]|uniref:serine/threonine-protein kinase n=1 Tax=Streptomyces sp. NPDC050560 TaxID=3365630 RepID=UPI0037BC1BA7
MTATVIRPLLPGDPDEISGYRLRGRLGSGGMGTVYLSHTRGGQRVALKVIRQEFAADPEFRRRFAREVAAAGRVQGAYTAAVLDSNTEGEQPWLASAYVPGPALSNAVATHGPLPPDTLLTLTAGIAEALQSVHAAGVVHRDLKPSNVLLASDGPRVIDFGIARAADATALTGTDVRLGTPAYMSPEQAEGRAAGAPLDVFALGLVAFFAATGGHPFGDSNGHALLFRIVTQEPDLTACPPELRPLVARCLLKDPARRPLPGEVVEECRRLADARNVDLVRREGWWLPESLAREATALEAPPPAGSGPSAPVPPQRPPLPPSPATEEDRVDAAPPAAPRRVGWRVPVALLAAVAVGVGGALLAERLRDDASGGGGGRVSGSPGYAVKQSDVPLTIPAPSYDSGTYVDAGACVSNQISGKLAGSVYVDLDALKVSSQQPDQTDADVDDAYDLRYADCSDSSGLGEWGESGGAGPTSGLKLLDNRGRWGTIDDRSPSPEQCRRAAASGNLPAKVSVGDIQKGGTLKKGTGVCVELKNRTLVLLWIDGVTPHKEDDGLTDFVTTAAQWVPK